MRLTNWLSRLARKQPFLRRSTHRARFGDVHLVAEILEDRLMLSGSAGDAAQPDFHLADVNTTSASFDSSVSPRDYLDQVSAWYFGHAN